MARSRTSGSPEAEPLSVFLDQGVVPRSEREDNHNQLGADLSRYLLVEPGDLVFNKLRTWQGGFGASRFAGIVSPAYFVLRAHPAVDSRYVDYLLHSTPYLAELTRLSKWMPPSQFDLAWEDLRDLPILLPPVEEQRRIANYLDDQTTRIDQTIQLRQQQLASLSERRAVAVDAILQELGVRFPAEIAAGRVVLPAGWVMLPLGLVVAEFTNGYVGPTRDILVDDGIPYVQSVHIKNGKIDFDRRPFYVTQQWFEARPRIQLQVGDVLIVQTGDIGQVAVVPPGFGDAACHALQIARASRRWLSGAYLGAYLSSQFARSHMLSRATGALHPHLEAGVKSVPIVVPPKETQSEILKTLETLRDGVGKAENAVHESVRLLHEKRRTLISTLTTGVVPHGD